ncbi:MAG: peptide ABC transporter substrate-binding protein [Clostridia bacterium]|nr:peptide ABC transporter substrate-binding protein [Clostridia bacterium]
MKTLKKFLCIILACVMVFSVSACSDDANNPEDQIINYNIVNEPVTLDPQIANDSGARLVIMNIFEGLVRVDADGNAVPGVAENWDISENGTLYTFHLRSNAKWNDGTDVTAYDFVFGIKRSLDPKTSSPTASTLYCIKNAENISKGFADISNLGINATDSHTLTIKLEHSYAEFLKILATPPAMPCNQKFFDSTAGQYGRDDDMILSNGAFYVRNSGWSHGEYIYLRKNSDYGGNDEPIPAGVNITIDSSPENVSQAISDGKIDCYALPGNEVSKAQELGFNLTSFRDTIWGISFNTQDDILKNKDVRCGLLSSLDRNYVLESIPENCVTASDIIPETAKYGDSSYRSAVGSNFYLKQSDSAKATLQNGLKTLQADSFPKIKILCTDDQATQSIVNNIIETWNKLTGSYVNKNPVSRSELDDIIASGDYQIVIAPLTVDGERPLDTLELFSSKSTDNIAKLSDSVYDGYIDKIKNLSDALSLKTTIEAEKYLNDNGIFYPLYLENRYYASAKNVTGIIFHPYGAEADFFYAKKTQD